MPSDLATAAPCCGRHNGTMPCAEHPAGCCENCPDHPEHRQPATAALCTSVFCSVAPEDHPRTPSCPPADVAKKRPLDITLTCGDEVKSLRAYLRSNIFDGDEEGTLTMRITPLLDEVIEVVTEWMKGPEADDDND